MNKIIAILVFLFTSCVCSAETNPFFGKYSYSAYQTTLSNGRTITLSQLGAQSATIEFRADMSIRMEMKMRDGSMNISNAKIINARHAATGGVIVEQWPDMNYPVTLEYKLRPDGLSYVIKFNEPSDAMRYGAKEEATLVKLGGH